MLLIGFVLFGACLVFGAAFVLLRTARASKVPKNFKPHVDDNEDSTGW